MDGSTVCNNSSNLAGVDHIIVQDDVHGTGELARWGLLGHLLDAQRLVVLVHRQTVLRLQGIPLLVLTTITDTHTSMLG